MLTEDHLAVKAHQQPQGSSSLRNPRHKMLKYASFPLSRSHLHGEGCDVPHEGSLLRVLGQPLVAESLREEKQSVQMKSQHTVYIVNVNIV